MCDFLIFSTFTVLSFLSFHFPSFHFSFLEAPVSTSYYVLARMHCTTVYRGIQQRARNEETFVNIKITLCLHILLRTSRNCAKDHLCLVEHQSIRGRMVSYCESHHHVQGDKIPQAHGKKYCNKLLGEWHCT